MPSEHTTIQYSLRTVRDALKKKQPGQAVPILKSLLARLPDHAEAWELLGVTHAMAGHAPAARRAFEEATRHNPHRASAHFNFALFLAGIEALDEAVQENNVALYLAPTHPGALALQKTLAERIHFRAYTAEEGFTAVGKGNGPSRDPGAAWNRLACPTCGAQNFVTARTCARCGDYLPEVEEIVPVE